MKNIRPEIEQKIKSDYKLKDRFDFSKTSLYSFEKLVKKQYNVDVEIYCDDTRLESALIQYFKETEEFKSVNCIDFTDIYKICALTAKWIIKKSPLYIGEVKSEINADVAELQNTLNYLYAIYWIHWAFIIVKREYLVIEDLDNVIALMEKSDFSFEWFFMYLKSIG